VLSASSLAAQDTLQTPVQQPPQPQGRVHVVQQGETLWGLAQLYLGDPLLWPEIYRLNTQVIEDPHWIFPGEQLQLGDLAIVAAEPVAEQPVVEQPPPIDTLAAQPPAMPPDTLAARPLPEQAQAVPGLPAAMTPDTTQPPVVEAPVVEAAAPPPPPPPADAGLPTIFARTSSRGAPTLVGTGLEYRAVRRGEFYSAGWLTEGEVLPWARVLGDVREPVAQRNASTSSVTLYREVEIEPPRAAVYQVGDSLLVAFLGREVPGWGNVVIPSGIARVTHVTERRAIAQVLQQFARVVDGQVVLPLERFNSPGNVAPVPVDDGPEGRVVDVRDRHFVPNQQDVVFIDLGRESGVVPGDVFELVREADPAVGAPPERGAFLQVVHVRQRSASALLLQIHRPGVRAGQRVRLVRKMPG
jgi:hypothetical protein